MTGVVPLPVSARQDFARGVFTSDFGDVDFTLCQMIQVVHGHCPQRASCVIVCRPLGPRIFYDPVQLVDPNVVQRMRIDDLAVPAGEGLISIEVDHVTSHGGPARWLYRLHPVRWFTSDGEELDTRIQLGRWPD
jgi:hypothetical protein